MNMALQARLTVALGIACAVFALLALLFLLGVGTGFGFLPPDSAGRQPLPSVASLEKQDFSMPEYAHFAEVTQRPLFSVDRRPIPPDLEVADAAPAAPPVPLQVVLTGVIITPELKVALLTDKTSNKPISIKLGMPLPGDQAVWSLTQVEPRMVVFRNDKDETSEVALDVSATSGSPRRGASSPAEAAKPPSDDDESAARQSLRERIEARRKQLREQAQQMRERQQQERTNEQDRTR